MNFFMKVI